MFLPKGTFACVCVLPKAICTGSGDRTHDHTIKSRALCRACAFTGVQHSDWSEHCTRPISITTTTRLRVVRSADWAISADFSVRHRLKIAQHKRVKITTVKTHFLATQILTFVLILEELIQGYMQSIGKVHNIVLTLWEKQHALTETSCLCSVQMTPNHLLPGTCYTPCTWLKKDTHTHQIYILLHPLVGG